MNTRKPTGEGTFSSNISGSAASASGSITVTDEFAQALSAIDQGRNVLISGRAGTGKSTLLRLFLERANQTVAGQPAKKVLITAPTGVAALNVGGFTIHKSFGFYVGLTPDALAAGKWKPAEAVRDVLQNMDLLVVDEISMVRADLFECMDLALRKVRGNPAPFGGVQLVLVGDLLQLPPVLTESEREAFLARWESPYFFAAESYDALDLVSIQLTHIWRQTDNEFIEILNQVREGSAGEQVLSLLNQQVDPNFEVPDDWVTLTATHRQVAKINKEHLEALGTPIHVSRASFTDSAEERDFPGEELLSFAEGMRVMMVANDPAGQYVNGSFGTLVVADYPSITEGHQVQIRLDHSGEVITVGRHTWNVKRPTVVDGKLTSEEAGSITQFPFIAAWALTVHKAQGKTIPKLFIDLTGGMRNDGQFYVALSRGVDLKHVRISQKVEARHIRANNSLVRRIRLETSEKITPQRLAFISFEGVSFRISEHIARIHAIVIDISNGTPEVAADFGSWINPNSDLGSFGTRHQVPAGGLSLVPDLGDFWPLLLRQVQGSLVVGDRLAMLERAVRHQVPGLATNLGTGYDFADFKTPLHGDDVVARANEMVEHYLSGNLTFERGELVPAANVAQEGAVYIPDWAPESPMYLDQHLATDSDNAWAAFSGSSVMPNDRAEVVETGELLSDWAISRGGWTVAAREEVVRRAARITNEPLQLPPPATTRVSLAALLPQGTRVAATGNLSIDNAPVSETEFKERTVAAGLVYKDNISKTQCDVLIAADIASMSNKARKARDWNKPIISMSDFSAFLNGDEATVEIASLPAPSEAGSAVKEQAAQNSDTSSLTSAATSADTSQVLPPQGIQGPGIPGASVADASGAADVPARTFSPIDVLSSGTRVAFRGSTYVFGKRCRQGDELAALCNDLGLEYKGTVSQSRCDVLVTDDLFARDGKQLLALVYGKPLVLATDFTAWAESQLTQEDTTDETATVTTGEEANASDDPVDVTAMSVTGERHSADAASVVSAEPQAGAEMAAATDPQQNAPTVEYLSPEADALLDRAHRPMSHVNFAHSTGSDSAVAAFDSSSIAQSTASSDAAALELYHKYRTSVKRLQLSLIVMVVTFFIIGLTAERYEPIAIAAFMVFMIASLAAPVFLIQMLIRWRSRKRQ